MSTANSILRKMARDSIRGKWTLVILTFLFYMVIVFTVGEIPKAGQLILLIISGPLSLGITIFSLSIARGQELKFEQIFQGFKHFGKALATYLLMLLFILLWSLLFIIPGIIAGLSYSMTFYLLADNPLLRANEAIEKSKKMMYGYKMKLFLMQLHFLLLAILSFLTLGIALLWVIPYIQVTLAKFYDDIKDKPIVK